jgi:hypothetical protein
MTECTPNSTVTINSAIISGALPGVPGPAGSTGYPEITETYVIDNPRIAGRRYLTFANLGSTITKVVILHEGTATSSTVAISHGANFQGLGTDIFAAPVTSTSSTVGDHYSTFVANADVVAASSHIWATVSAASATTDKLIINITRTVVPVATAGTSGIPIQDSGTGQGYLPLVELP